MINDFVKIRDIYCPDIINYSINPDGIVRNDLTGKLTSRYTVRTRDESLKLVTDLRTNKGVFVTRSIALLLAMMFLETPIGFDKYKYIIGFKDDDHLNVNLSNLYWLSRSQWYQQKRADKISSSLITTLFSPNETGLYPNPIPYPDKEGYYLVPYRSSNLIINKAGDVINAISNRKVSVHLDHYGYPAFAAKTDIDKPMRCVKLHRILCMLFVEIPEHLKHISIDDLFVNHKNGIKIDFTLTNLEWCTPSENVQHAREVLGLGKQNVPIIRKNVITGEEERFKTLSAVESVNMKWKSMAAHVVSKHAGTINYNNFVYKIDDGTPWPKPLVKSPRGFMLDDKTNTWIPRNRKYVSAHVLS